MAEKIAKPAMVVRQIRQAIVITVEALLDHAHRNDLPKVHARATVARVNLPPVGLANHGEDPVARRAVAPQGLETEKNTDHVIARAQVEIHLLNGNRAEHGLILIR